MIGNAGETIAGRPLTDLLWEFIGLENVLKDILRGEQPEFRLEHINRVQIDGTIHYQTFLVTPFEAIRPGEGLLLLVEDTTDYGRLRQDLVQERNELRLVRQKLAAANQELEKLNCMKSFLVSMAAHDLRGPLSSILGFAAFLKEDVADNEQLEYLDIIISQSDRMRRLIENLLDFDQIEQGLLVLEWRDCDLNDVVNEVVNALRLTAKLRKQSLTFNQLTRPLVICADSNRLTHIVYNLLDNAVKYTPEGGHIRISLRRQKNEVEIEVADNGLGISDDKIAYYFTHTIVR
jgi:signal transduction histidine kinase